MSEDSVCWERFSEVRGLLRIVAKWVTTLVFPVPVSPVRSIGSPSEMEVASLPIRRIAGLCMANGRECVCRISAPGLATKRVRSTRTPMLYPLTSRSMSNSGIREDRVAVWHSADKPRW